MARSTTNTVPPTTLRLHGDTALANRHSTQSTGHWVILRPSFSQEIDFYTNWITTFARTVNGPANR